MLLLFLLPMNNVDKLPLMLSMFFVMPIYQLILANLVPASLEQSKLEHLVSNIFYLMLFIIGLTLLSALLADDS